MINLISTSHLVLILSLVIPLAARSGVPKALRLVARLLWLLLSVENSAAIIDGIIGTVVAWLPIRENPALPCDPVASRRDGISRFPTSEFYLRWRITRRAQQKTRRDSSRRATLFKTRWSRAESAPMPNV
jgi:hypothetical protein